MPHLASVRGQEHRDRHIPQQALCPSLDLVIRFRVTHLDSASISFSLNVDELIVTTVASNDAHAAGTPRAQLKIKRWELEFLRYMSPRST